jgi:serine/threonine protein kinase
MLNFSGKSLGRYYVIEPLGEGGMAAVFKAFDTTLEREVAVKVIRVEKGMADSFRKRFQREARALAQLDHPFILKVLDYGEQDGVPYLVMPYLSGGTLKDRLGSPMPYSEAARLLTPIASALEFAHREGIIHRDIKPANILIGKTGEPMLSDFGIAKLLDQKAGTQLTGTGISIGTPDYMAPEQWLGKVEARTDVYSLGIVFYELVTGRRPYVADTPAAVFLKHREDPLPRPRQYVPELPVAVEQVIFKALAKSVVDRYATMGEFAAALEKLAQEKPAVGIGEAAPTRLRSPQSAARPSPKPPHKPSKSDTFPWKTAALAAAGIILVAAVCLAAGGGLLLTGWLSRGSEPPVSAAVTQTPLTATEVLLAPTDTPIPPSPTPLPEETPVEIFLVPLEDGSQSFGSVEDMPEGIPLLPENNGDLMTESMDGVTVYIYSTNMERQAAEDFINEFMAADGWVQYDTTFVEGSTMLFFENKMGPMFISLTEDDEGIIWVEIIADDLALH